MALTNEEARNLDSLDKLEDLDKTEKEVDEKQEKIGDEYSLEISMLTGADTPAVAEIRRALTFTDFYDYFDSLGDEYQKRLGLFFTKVFIKNKRNKKTPAIDLSVFQSHSRFPASVIEWAFYEVQSFRSSDFKVDGDFSYKRLLQLKESSTYIAQDLAMKTYLAVEFPEQVLALSFLMSADFATIGYLFKTLPEVNSQLIKIRNQFKENPNSKEAIKRRMDLFFGDDILEQMAKDGIL